MSVSVEQLIGELVHLGLMPEEEARDYCRPEASAPGIVDPRELARQLIAEDRITRYQAETILRGNADDLALGECVLLRKIGEGGMGQVYQAVHRRLQRPAAVKVLGPESLNSPDAVERFHQEVQVAARLDHPNIVATYDAGQQGDVHYLVMEHVEGLDLAALVRRRGPLPPAEALDYVLQAAEGLKYAHDCGVVHRDVKPSNLLLSRDGKIKILDMGLARITEDEDAPVGATLAERLTRRGDVLGTVDYMSPEQALDTRTADHRADVYSLGCTLYRLLTGRAVYSGESAVMKLMAHCEGEIPSLDEASDGIPPQLNRAFSRMVAKQPEDRQQSMNQVIDELQACVDACRSEGPSKFSPDRLGTSAADEDDELTLTSDRDTRATKSPTKRIGAAPAEETIEVASADSGFCDEKTSAARDQTIIARDKRVVTADNRRILLLLAGILGLGALVVGVWLLAALW